MTRVSARIVVPPPPPASDRCSVRSMRSNRRRDTAPERLVRSELHALGYRYRTDFPVFDGQRSRRVDIAFTRARVAVFIDGCFWHGCARHRSIPTTNAEYWGAKIARNRQRDAE